MLLDQGFPRLSMARSRRGFRYRPVMLGLTKEWRTELRMSDAEPVSGPVRWPPTSRPSMVRVARPKRAAVPGRFAQRRAAVRARIGQHSSPAQLALCQEHVKMSG